MADIPYQAPPPDEADLHHDEIESRLSYNARTGVLRWKKQVQVNKSVMKGDVAGYTDHRGYLFVRINRKLYLGHRIAWLLHYGAWPSGDLDHKNGNKSDNRIVNLRLASRSQNIANSFRRNRELPKGAYRLKGRKRWYSSIGGKNLGTFATADEAAAAFKAAHKKMYGEFSLCEGK